MNSLSRSTALKIAAVLSFVSNAYSIIAALTLIPVGAAANNANPESIPYFVIVLGLILGVIGVISAYGTWKQQRWGIVLTIVANLLNALSAAPGILFAPTQALFISAIISVIVGVLVVVLCLWPGRQVVTA